MIEAPWLNLAIAIGVGLMIGLERERSKGVGSARRPAGIRTFTLAALLGAIACSSRRRSAAGGCDSRRGGARGSVLRPGSR